MVSRIASPVEYFLPMGEEKIGLNSYLGRVLSLRFTGEIICRGCARAIRKSYQEGYCFPCTQRLARCDFCILKPSLCHYHRGTCREPTWGETHCMIPHYVYLANTSGAKVGITRKEHAMTRWIDQGAIAALPMVEVTTRRVSGLIEHVLANAISDRTHWQRMLKGEVPTIDLVAIRDRLRDKILESIQTLSEEERRVQWSDHSVYEFHYPILEHPKQVKSLSFDKTPLIEGTLLGIKGQYLIFDTGVLNIRKHSGYIVTLT